jgi:hypothetical protein
LEILFNHIVSLIASLFGIERTKSFCLKKKKSLLFTNQTIVFLLKLKSSVWLIQDSGQNAFQVVLEGPDCPAVTSVPYRGTLSSQCWQPGSQTAVVGILLGPQFWVCDQDCVWPGLCVTRAVCDQVCVWPGPCVTRTVCDQDRVWPGLCVTRTVCDQGRVWPGLCVTRAVCDQGHVTRSVCDQGVCDEEMRVVLRPRFPITVLWPLSVQQASGHDCVQGCHCSGRAFCDYTVRMGAQPCPSLGRWPRVLGSPLSGDGHYLPLCGGRIPQAHVCQVSSHKERTSTVGQVPPRKGQGNGSGAHEPGLRSPHLGWFPKMLTPQTEETTKGTNALTGERPL